MSRSNGRRHHLDLGSDHRVDDHPLRPAPHPEAGGASRRRGSSPEAAAAREPGLCRGAEDRSDTAPFLYGDTDVVHIDVVEGESWMALEARDRAASPALENEDAGESRPTFDLSDTSDGDSLLDLCVGHAGSPGTSSLSVHNEGTASLLVTSVSLCLGDALQPSRTCHPVRRRGRRFGAGWGRFLPSPVGTHAFAGSMAVVSDDGGRRRW